MSEQENAANPAAEAPGEAITIGEARAPESESRIPGDFSSFETGTVAGFDGDGKPKDNAEDPFPSAEPVSEDKQAPADEAQEVPTKGESVASRPSSGEPVDMHAYAKSQGFSGYEEFAQKAMARELKRAVEWSEKPLRAFMPGTVFKLGDVAVKTTSPVLIESDMTDQAYAGLLQLTGNLDVNRDLLKFRYDSMGKLAGLNEQVDDPNALPAFIASLDEAEAYLFGIDGVTLAEYKRNVEAANAEAAANLEAASPDLVRS